MIGCDLIQCIFQSHEEKDLTEHLSKGPLDTDGDWIEISQQIHIHVKETGVIRCSFISIVDKEKRGP